MKPADAYEIRIITKALTSPFVLDGVALPPAPAEEAKEQVRGALEHVVAWAHVDDYVVGQAPDETYFTTLLGIMNTVLAQFLPGVFLAPTETGLIFMIDHHRFYEDTIPSLSSDEGVVGVGIST